MIVLQDKDPEALTDTRRSQPPAPAKSDFETLMEKHKNDLSEYDIMPPTTTMTTTIPPPAPYAPQPPRYMYPAAYIPTGPYPAWNQSYETAAYEEPLEVEEAAQPEEVTKDYDDDELALLGIDPNDLAGFGN